MRAEPVLPIRDGLPKLKDFPTEFGGSGETAASRSSDAPEGPGRGVWGLVGRGRAR